MPIRTEPRFDQETIGGRMRWLREKKLGLSRAALGEKLRPFMEDDTLRHKEDGQNPFYLHEISAICDLASAPSLFPFLDWDAAVAVDKFLNRPLQPSPVLGTPKNR